MPKKEGDNRFGSDVRLPWRKIVFSGAIVIILVVVSEIISKYWDNLRISFSVPKIIMPTMQKPFAYSLAFSIIISLILVLIILKRKNQKNEKQEVVSEKNVKKILKITDDLLRKLPKKEIDKFAKTDDAKLYSNVMKNYGVK